MKKNSLLGLLLMLAAQVSAEPASGFIVLAKLMQGPGNVTVTDTGRIVFSQHQFYQPQYSVVELNENGAVIPFPNKALNDRSNNSGLKLDSVLGIRTDSNGIVWMLDNGMRSGIPPKLVGWNSKTDTLHRVIDLSSAVPKDHFVNDFAVDLKHNSIYISDPAGGGNAALIVVNLGTGSARRVLQGHSSVVPENLDLIINGRPVQVKDASGNVFRPHIGVNSITEDLQNEWVYFGPMSGLNLYRIKAADLSNEGLEAKALTDRVERYSAKPISDGISIDKNNNIYLGELAENAIGVITPDRNYKKLSQSADLSWVDSLSFGPGDKLYAVVNRLHQSAVLNAGESVSKPPYFLVQVDALAAGMAGR